MKILFWYYRKDYYQPVSKIDSDLMLDKIANLPELKRFPDYLEQCATTAKNQFLVSKDPTLYGTIFAMLSLKEQIKKKRVKIKKELTQEEKVGIMRKRGY